jgi:5-methylcytosine-specific restriction endonuclease McrA
MVRLAIKAQPYCSYCGVTTDLTGDHITQLALGGLNVPSNIRVACRSCNSARGARLSTSRVPTERPADDDVWTIA